MKINRGNEETTLCGLSEWGNRSTSRTGGLRAIRATILIRSTTFQQAVAPGIVFPRFVPLLAGKQCLHATPNTPVLTVQKKHFGVHFSRGLTLHKLELFRDVQLNLFAPSLQ